MTKRFDYEMVYEYIKEKISHGLIANDKIPSENELCTRFNITRTTVRQGINKLKSEGLIYSRQGSGYFVSYDKIKYTLSQNTVFSNEILKLGKTPQIKILNIQSITTDDPILKKFTIQNQHDILKVTLLRTVNQVPILVGYSYLSTLLMPDIDIKLASTHSFTSTFKAYGLEPIRNYSELEIVPCDDTFKELLQIQSTLPLIKIASTSSDTKSGEIIEYVESYFRSDLVTISIDFNPIKEVAVLQQ